MIDEWCRNAISLRGWQGRILADDEGDAAVGVDVIGAVLRVVLQNEEGSIVPIGAVGYSVNDTSDGEGIVGD